MIYTRYDKIHTVLGIGRAPPGLPGFTKTGPKGLLVGSTGPGYLNGPLHATTHTTLSAHRGHPFDSSSIAHPSRTICS
jgi:hypothetical protein